MPQVTLGLTRLLGHGRAFTQVIGVDPPAAGSAFIYTVADYWEIVDSLAFRLVTSSHVSNRQVTVNFLDGGGVLLASFSANAVQAATQTRDYALIPNINNPTGPTNGIFTMPCYIGLLQPGFSVQLVVGNIDAADQVSNIRFNQERFVTGAEGYLLGVVDVESPEGKAALEASTVLA